MKITNTIIPENFINYFKYDNGQLYWKEQNKRKTRLMGKPVGNMTGKYLRVNLGEKGKGKMYAVHRIIWVMNYGQIPPDKELDHINNCTTDNRIENLRLCTSSENNGNRGSCKNVSSVYKGVHLSKNKKWKASIKYNGKIKHLGTFEKEIDAAMAYNTEALKLWGKFANINNITGVAQQSPA